MNARLVCAIVVCVTCVADAQAVTELVSGRVVDGEGKPIAKARVIANRPEQAGQPYVQTFAATTHPDGTFVLWHNPMGGDLPKGSLAMQVSCPGHPSVERLVAVPTQNLEIVLGDGATLKVRALGTDGKPVADARVLVQQTGAHKWPTFGNQREPDLRTDKAGLLSVPGLGAGEYSVVVSTPGTRAVTIDEGDGHMSYLHERRELDAARAKVTIAADAKTVTVDVKREAEKLTLEGRVVDAAGAPIAGASVVGDGVVLVRVATTAADGTFVLERMPAGFYVRVTAWKQGYEDPNRFSMAAFVAGAPAVKVSLIKN